MQVIINPSPLKGNIQAPASKSSMQRACAAALLSRKETVIINPGYSNDDKAALRVIEDLGAQIELQTDGSLKIIGHQINPSKGELNCGESGLGIRMFAPIIALSKKPVIISGKGSLLTRPMHFFDEIFPKLGVEIISDKGKLPMRIKGPLVPKNIEIDGSLSSQFLTGLLMAFAGAGARNVTIKVKDLKSKPYIDLTLAVMHQFGWRVENRDYREFYFPPHTNINPQETSVSYVVEGDWSGGAFLLVAGAIAGKITVTGLDAGSTQADKAILEALKRCGAKMIAKDNQVEIGSSVLGSFHFDANDCPDLFPPLVALASYCNGVSTIKGVNRLKHKESDRALTLKMEFAKMGVEIKLQDDLMHITGNKNIHGALVHSNHDHRIAMACAVAALHAEGETIIVDADAVDKSYPDFFDHLKFLGASVSLTN